MSHSGGAQAWFFAENGAQAGPFTEQQMAGFARAGRIGPETLVWTQGAAGWLPLRDTPLQRLFAQPPAPPAPPPFAAPQPASYAPPQPAPYVAPAPAYAAAPPPYTPAPSLGFGAAVSTCFNKYASFQGRARRSEFWYFELFAILLSIVTGVVDVVAFPGLVVQGISPLNAVTGLALLAPGISVMVRRLHDTDRSGFHFWWILLPVVGWIILLVFLVQRGTDGPNRFG